MRMCYKQYALFIHRLLKKNILYIEMNCATAEIAKLTASMFLSLRMALINEMTDLCEAAGGNIGNIGDVIKAVSTE